MLSQELRQTIQALHQQGISLREIGRTLKISRNTVRNHLDHSPSMHHHSHQWTIPSVVHPPEYFFTPWSPIFYISTTLPTHFFQFHPNQKHSTTAYQVGQFL
ncbi:MAG: helix-turn-helix domain-containing protein [Magnetococcus sp. DMHC-6]